MRKRPAWIGSLEPAALAAMIVYGLLSLALSPEFPFATVDMYSNIGRRREGAIPVLLVGGEEVDARTLTDFAGIDPQLLTMDGEPCSEAYRLDAIRNYVSMHRAPVSTAAGDVSVSFAWRRYHMQSDGTMVDDPTVVVVTGTARRAR